MAGWNGTAHGMTQTTAPRTTVDTAFKGLGTELSGLLEVHEVPLSGQSSRKLLVAENPDKPFLPGQPRIRLPTGVPSAAGPSQEEEDLLKYLRRSHLTLELDGILPFMKYIFVSTHVPQSLSRRGISTSIRTGLLGP